MNLVSNVTIIRVIGHLTIGEAETHKDGQVAGPLIEILNDLKLMTKFSFDTMWIPSAEEDSFQKQIVPRVNNEEFDLICGHYYLTPSRLMSGVIPLMPLIDEKFTAYFRQPHFTTVRNIFSQPFTTSLFFAYFFLSFLFFVCIGATLGILKKTTTFIDTFSQASWFIIAFIGLKDCNFLIKGPTLQSIFISGSLFFTLMYSVYSAFITSALTSSISAVNSISDLIKYEFTFQAPLSIRSSIFSKHYKEPRIRNNNEMTALESFQLAIRGKHVHVDDPDYFLEFADTTKYSPAHLCKKISALPFVAGTSSGFFVPRGSAFKDVFNQKITKMNDVGLLHRMNSVFRKERVYNCPKVNHGFQENLGLSHVFFAFVLLSFGVSAVLTIFLLERLTALKNCR